MTWRVVRVYNGLLGDDLRIASTYSTAVYTCFVGDDQGGTISALYRVADESQAAALATKLNAVDYPV